MKSTLFVLMTLSMVWCAPSYSKAAEAEKVSLPLEEAIAITVKNNPEIAAALFKKESSDAMVREARSGFIPQVDFVETFNRTTNPMWAFGAKLNQESIGTADFNPETLNDPDAINNYNSALMVTWPLYSGGKIYTAFKQAGKNREADMLMADRTRQMVIAKTITLYMGMKLAQENLSVVNHSLESAKANLNMVASSFGSGFAVKSDLLRAQVRIADLEQQRLQAESQTEIAQAALNAIMGSPDNTPLILTSPFEKCGPFSGEISQWIDKALSNRPDLKMFQCREEMARHEIRIAKSGHYPSIHLRGVYEKNSADFDHQEESYTVGAVMQMNLFKGFGIDSKIRNATASLSQLQELMDGMKLGIRMETREAFLEAASSWQRIQVSQSALNQADEGLRIVQNRYKTGLLTLVSLLDAELANQQAKMSHKKALHDYKVAMAKLALAAGTIDETFKF